MKRSSRAVAIHRFRFACCHCSTIVDIMCVLLIDRDSKEEVYCSSKHPVFSSRDSFGFDKRFLIGSLSLTARFCLDLPSY